MAGKRKKRRRDRRRKTVVAGLGEIPDLARRRPRDAARILARARRGEGALRGTASELDELTVLVCGELRKARRFDEAFALLRTLATRSPVAALEEALIAFARGDDTRVREVAEQTPELAPILSPLISSATGQPARRSPRGSSGALKVLYAAARAVGNSARGDRAAALRVAGAIEEPGFRAPMRSAIRLVSGAGTLDDLDTLDPIGTPELRTLASIAHASCDPDEAIFRVGASVDHARVKHHALAALAREASPEELNRIALHVMGPEVFDRPGDAMLRSGFERVPDGLGELGEDGDAGLCFEQALELGADMGECLRGSWIARRERARSSFRTADHRMFITAARAYEHLLAKDVRHAAMRATVLLDVAMARCGLGIDLDAALRDVSTVRASLSGHWLDTRALQSTVDRVEAHIHIERGDQEAARPLADRALAHDGREPRSWELALDLASPEDVPALAAQAYAATRDERFFKLARPSTSASPAGPSTSASPAGSSMGASPVGSSMGASPAGSSMSASPAPGPLARELADAPQGSVGAALENLETRAALLSDEARVHFDVGALHILRHRDAETAAEAYLDARLRDTSAPRKALLLTGLALDLVPPVRAYFDRLQAPRDTADLADVVAYAALMVGRPAADVLLGRLSVWLRAAELKALRARVDEGDDDPVFDVMDEVCAGAHSALHPEICLAAYLDLEDAHLDHDEGPLDEGPPAEVDVDVMLGMLLTMMGVPVSTLEEIPADRKLAFIEKASGLGKSGPGMQRALTELLGYDALRGPRARRPKKRNKKKRKKKRR